MCGNGECGNQQICTLYANSKDNNTNLYRKDVQYELPNCWVCNIKKFPCVGRMRQNEAVAKRGFFLEQDATENIITHAIAIGGHKDGGNQVSAPLSYHSCHQMYRHD